MEGQQVEFQLEYPETLPPPEAVNHFRISRVGNEVQLLVGYVDIGRLAKFLEEAKEQKSESPTFTLQPEISHRFSIGLGPFQELWQKVNHIYTAMEAAGHYASAEEEADS